MSFARPLDLESQAAGPDAPVPGTPAALAAAAQACVIFMRKLGGTPNKGVVVFHLAFKIATLFFYLFAALFNLNFIILFVLVVFLSAFDFWTVKNISGRILVGLRWWNEVREDSNVWVFESKPEGTFQVHPTESTIFWAGIYISPLVWIFFCISALFSKYLIVAAVPLILTTANFIGYWKCQSDAKAKMAAFIMQQL